jgi:diamine N-acetyltransferase
VVDAENERAMNVYTKLGFKKEGLLIKEFFVDGIYRDAYRMAVFQSEYLEIKNYS